MSKEQNIENRPGMPRVEDVEKPKVDATSEQTAASKRRDDGAKKLTALLEQRGMTEADLEGVELTLLDDTSSGYGGQGYRLKGTIKEGGKLVEISAKFSKETHGPTPGRVKISSFEVKGNDSVQFHAADFAGPGPHPQFKYEQRDRAEKIIKKWGDIAEAMRDRDGKPRTVYG